VVDDAYSYGAIAAANALSDLYAMGAAPFLALNIAAFPTDLPAEVVSEILRGGAEKVREAGAVLAGGHTVQDKEPKYGLVALGLIETGQLMTKAGARPGDVLVLTKPIGSGVTTTALKRSTAEPSDVAAAVAWMKALNVEAARLALGLGVRGATDVTGFSLLGHGLEMADASGVQLHFYLPAIPFLRGARRYAAMGAIPGGSADNRLYFGRRVTFDASIDEIDRTMLFDAQTSGGLLLSLPAESLPRALDRARAGRIPLWVIGAVESGEGAVVHDGPPPRPGASIDDSSVVVGPEAAKD
jgi:selenide,water dikinase